MDKFLFKKVELWLVALIIVFLLIGTFAFGVIVRDAVYGNNRLGAISRISLQIASLPSEAARSVRMAAGGDLAGMSTLHSDRFPGRSGWSFFDTRQDSGLDAYLFFSRHDGDAGHHVFELVDLKAGEIVHRIAVDFEKTFADASRTSLLTDYGDWRNERFQAVHPLALENGDILIKGNSTPMVRMTPCGDPVWTLNNGIYHHTTEAGPDGHYWSSAFVEPPRVEGLSEYFYDPGITQFSADGEVLYDSSLTKIMIEQGLGYMALAKQFDRDPIHLNDVQPVFEDGPYWKRGDVLLSLRNMSTIMLFRPSEDRIVWWKQGPWAAQHDVDVIDEKTIGVYNNNSLDIGDGRELVVQGNSQIVFYDLETKTHSNPFEDVLIEHEFKNEAAGLFTVLPDGHYYVDESESGRTMIFTPEGELAVEHINRAENGLIYHLGWSRIMDREAGDRFLKQLKDTNCG
ncbi:MAG: arylsulfotransferase family protein [Arenibacterium sp.]